MAGTNNFRGYYMKCNGCTFQNPSFKREGFKFAPNLIQVTDAGQVASGKLSIKVLPHIRRKIWCSFPPLTQEQYREYAKILRLKDAGQSMRLTIEAYDDMSDSYITDVYYHTDIIQTPVYYNGEKYVIVDDFELIGY